MIVPGHTTQVDFHSSGLTILKRELLEGAFRLQTADFSENFLKNLPFDLFVKNQIISEINLSKNQIHSVPPRLFLGLNQLKSIDLSHNQITTLNKLLFKDANSVTHLDLSNNRLLSITRVTLMNMINLQSLDLSSNRFRDLSPLKFDGKQLESIKLDHNNLDKLSMTMFKYLDNVKTFSARGNRLEAIPSFISNKLPSAIAMDFGEAQNKISEIKEDQFKNATRLKRLFMEDNAIKDIPESAFGECETLVFLDFRRNRFKRVKNDWIKKCANLTHVFFGQNDIQEVPKALFNPHENLRTFDLSNNRIKKLPVEFAEENQDLAHIFLQNNLIKRLPTHLFYGSERLKSIDLANNRLLTVGNVLPRDLNIRPDHVNLINLSRNKNVGEELNKRWAGYDSWHYKSGAVLHPVEDPMTAFENALKESSHHLRSLNPTGGLVERFGFTPFEDDQEEAGALGLRRALDNLSGTSFGSSALPENEL
ncbi:Oidioi.mRNA.OKI2018_I69.XSR.g13703.t1.cds [Oikopleura dioica]|uniref:Oidioi.mRNA.OKI2018_I69.XSR.g13703.t1.cds n=1 Tax=Oikopleura dioica TaxID=34765 RepID=A0ABN7SBK1_OIKDI|nr:Oidioi.mRNA.OKI2018_I69.XSR.g13703.t1.cds [Oikopleura dioica]